MRNRTCWLTVSVCAATLGAGLAFADNPKVAERQKNQQERINQGVGNGQLTKREASRLGRNSAKIHRSIAKDRRDGGEFTAKERMKAHKRLNKQNRAIARQKHDRQKR